MSCLIQVIIGEGSLQLLHECEGRNFTHVLSKSLQYIFPHMYIHVLIFKLEMNINGDTFQNFSKAGRLYFPSIDIHTKSKWQYKHPLAHSFRAKGCNYLRIHIHCGDGGWRTYQYTSACCSPVCIHQSRSICRTLLCSCTSVHSGAGQ